MVKRYIDPMGLKASIVLSRTVEDGKTLEEIIDDEPSADVIEIKHGTWTVVNKQQGNETTGFWTERYLQCSVCNYERRHSWLRGEQPNYCENCGSDMRGE